LQVRRYVHKWTGRPALSRPDTARDINRCLGELGFSYVTLDLGGYKTGSMNKGLAEVDKKEKMM